MKLQEKIQQTPTLVRKPTHVRLEENMLADFKRRVMVAQVSNPAEDLVTIS
jgi:NADH-quinone oxidoreductase subunit B